MAVINMINKYKIRDMERLAEYQDTLYRHPRLTYLFFELTDACNLTCMHCGSSASPQNRQYLSREHYRKVIDSVAGKYIPHTVMICLTGGEPMLHPDFYRFAAYARKRGFSCGITTNGTLIDKTAAQKIARCGIGSVTFSLDGTSETHNKFRGGVNTYLKTIAGIQNLLEASNGRITTQITTVVHKGNIDELDAIYKVVSNLGVDSWRIINLEPIGRALEHPELLLDANDYRMLFEYIRQKRYDNEVTIDVTYIYVFIINTVVIICFGEIYNERIYILN